MNTCVIIKLHTCATIPVLPYFCPYLCPRLVAVRGFLYIINDQLRTAALHTSQAAQALANASLSQAGSSQVGYRGYRGVRLQG